MKKEKEQRDNQELLGNFKRYAICLLKHQKEKKERLEQKKYLEEIMTGNVPRFGTNNESQIQKAQKMSINTNSSYLGISYSSYKQNKTKKE